MDDTLDEDAIHKLIEEHLPIKEKEKANLGEVFTPVVMINELYNNFPKSVWKNPSYTWLDPASGVGNFSLVLYFKLMNGLKSVIPNNAKRSKHIIEKMLYMIEINKTNVTVCRKLFSKLCPDATLNIYQGDALKFNPDDIGWPKTFDCVIGNPPYNIGGTGLEGSKRTHIIFTKMGIDLLNKNGFLAYVCPPSYREANTPMNQIFKDAGGHFVYIKIYGAPETHKLFKIQGRVDGFIFQKDAKGRTTIKDEYDIVTSNVVINLDRHIPNFGFSIFDKLYSKVHKFGRLDAFRNTEMSSVKANTFGCDGRYKLLHLILEKGKRVFKTDKQHSLATTPKILINGLGVPYVYYDADGKYGPSQTPVIVLKPSKNVVALLQSVLFSFIAWGLRLTGNNNLPYIFDAIPDVGKDKVHSYKTLNDIQTALGLTKQEIKFITENFHVYEYKNVDLIEPCKRSKTVKLKKVKLKTRKQKSNL
jgi:hypothetical protein